MEEQKTLKQYCREAKMRLKKGFWQNYKKDLENELERASLLGISASKVKDYYVYKVESDIKNKNKEHDEFYSKVKKMLDEEGEVSNALGRLTDKEYFNTLSYEQKQRYSLSLSEKYLKAVERYKKEKELEYN